MLCVRFPLAWSRVVVVTTLLFVRRPCRSRWILDAESHRDTFAESVCRLKHWSKSQLVLRTPIQASYGTRWRDFSVNPTQTTSWRFAGAQGLRVLAPTDNNTRKPRLPTSRLTGSVQPRRAERLELTFSMASISMSEFGPMNLNRSAMSNPSGWW